MRPRSARRSSSGPGSEPLGTRASATTRNTIATTSAAAPARSRNHSGVAAPPARMGPASAWAMGPATANPTSPASSSRTSPNRSPSSRRASRANPPTIPTTLSRISTAVRATASTRIGDPSFPVLFLLWWGVAPALC
jgi:hypothetical protein